MKKLGAKMGCSVRGTKAEVVMGEHKGATVTVLSHGASSKGGYWTCDLNGMDVAISPKCLQLL